MALFGKTEIEYQGQKINLGKWERLPLLEAIKKYLKIDVSKIKDDKEAKEIAKKHGIEKTEEVTKLNLPDELMKTFRDKIIQPTFLTDYPIEMCPLAKPSQKDPTKAEIFQPIVAGMELARAYSELNDPHLQEASFLEQEEERKKGNKEAMPTDMDFVTALSHGMPPACGVGIGIERLVMLFANQTTIRNVIMFPFMKPEQVRESNPEKREGLRAEQVRESNPEKREGLRAEQIKKDIREVEMVEKAERKGDSKETKPDKKDKAKKEAKKK
jgi:lysyl-tRNA synthetase class 2